MHAFWDCAEGRPQPWGIQPYPWIPIHWLQFSTRTPFNRISAWFQLFVHHMQWYQDLIKFMFPWESNLLDSLWSRLCMTPRQRDNYMKVLLVNVKPPCLNGDTRTMVLTPLFLSPNGNVTGISNQYRHGLNFDSLFFKIILQYYSKLFVFLFSYNTVHSTVWLQRFFSLSTKFDNFSWYHT